MVVVSSCKTSKIPRKREPVVNRQTAGLQVIGEREVVHDADFAAAAAFPVGEVIPCTQVLVAVRIVLLESFSGIRVVVQVLLPLVGDFSLEEKTFEHPGTKKQTEFKIQQSDGFGARLFVRGEKNRRSWTGRERTVKFVSDHGRHTEAEDTDALPRVVIEDLVEAEVEAAAVPEFVLERDFVIAFAFFHFSELGLSCMGTQEQAKQKGNSGEHLNSKHV